MDSNKKMMKKSTSEKGMRLLKDDRLNFDKDNKLLYHKWEVPSNMVGTMSSNQIVITPGIGESVGNPLPAARPKLVRPLSSLSQKPPRYLSQAKSRPTSASSHIFTFQHFNPTVIVGQP